VERAISPETEISAFDRLFAQASESVRRCARRVQGFTDDYRTEYRTTLDALMQLRARVDRATRAPESLRIEHESLGREVAAIQGRLKRLDVASRQLSLIDSYLASADPRPVEPALDTTDVSAEAVALRVIQAQEGERQRLAEEVHDGPAQVLTNAIFQVEYLDRVVGDSPQAARRELAFLRSMLREGLDEVRGFIAELRPPATEIGLGKAIRGLAADFERRHGISVDVRLGPIDARISPADRASVLRIVQEALRNVHKHAAASAVSITFEGDSLVIADNGRGFDVMRFASATSRNFGLQFMRERAELIGSRLRIESRQGEGTRILLRVPE
jgi:two-component system sensor histidine kinase DegS